MVSQDRVVQLHGEFHQLSEQPSSANFTGSSSGGEPPWEPLESRVSKLEDHVGDIKQTLRELAPKITEMHAALQPMREDSGLLKSQYGDVVRDVATTKTDLSQEIADARLEFSKEISDTRAGLSKDIGEIRTVVAEIKGMVSKLPSVVTIIATVIGAIGVVFAGLAVLAYFAK